MIQQKSFFRKLLSLSLLAVLAVGYACSSTTDPDVIDIPEPPTPEPPPAPPPPEIPDGERVMIIQVTDRSNEPLTGYDIDISGPTSASADGVGESSFRFADLESGEYTIVVTLEDYIEGEITLEVELPESVKEDFEVQDVVSLAKLAPPVVIKNDEESTVEADSDDEEAEEDEKLVMKIPANTFPPEAQDEDGNVQIRVTRAAPAQLTTTDEGFVNDELRLEPSGVTLNNPVEVTIPINAIAGATYVLQPGNIPLTPVAGKNSAPGLMSENRTVLEFGANLETFQNYTVVANVTVQKTLFTTSANLNPSECGGDARFEFSVPKIETPSGGNVLEGESAKVFRNYNTFYGGSDNVLAIDRTIANDNDGFRIIGQAVKSGIEYTLVLPGANESFFRNTALTLSATTEVCHGN